MKAKSNDRNVVGKGYEALVALRRLIIGGRLQPGEKLPPLRQLAQTWNVSFLTVQQATARMVNDGFLTTHGRAGTAVAENPPHLCHLGLVFPTKPNDDRSRSWSHFFTSLLREASGLEMLPGRRFIPYFGVDGVAENDDSLRLRKDIENRRLAGVVMLTPTACEQFQPALKNRALPLRH